MSSSFDNTDSEEDEEEEEDILVFVPEPSNKRKRAESETPVSRMYELNLSDSEEEQQDHAPTMMMKKKITKNNNNNSQQKRRKKNKATSFTPRYKKYQKKKNNSLVDTPSSLPIAMSLSVLSPTKTTVNNNLKNSTLTNKDKKEELDQNKESISSPARCQLIESVAENEKDKKTVFQHLTEASIDWCRYCGTTEGVNWRPGPWGKRTLCK
jgi:hypothetical protein